MSTTRSALKKEFVDVDTIGSHGVPDRVTYPNPSCHILAVLFDEDGIPYVQVSSVGFREGKLKMTSGGALENGESVLAAGVREAEEESPSLKIRADMIQPYALQYPGYKGDQLKYVTFSVAAFVQNGYKPFFTEAEQKEIIRDHNASDALAKQLLDLAFTGDKPNNLKSYDELLSQLIAENKGILPLTYLKACQIALHKFLETLPGNVEAQIKSAQDSFLETIRIKTEFVGRAFISLAVLKEACQKVVEIDVAEKEGKKDLPKKPEFEVASDITAMNGKKCKLFGANVESIYDLIMSERFNNVVAERSNEIRKAKSAAHNMHGSFAAAAASTASSSSSSSTPAPTPTVPTYSFNG